MMELDEVTVEEARRARPFAVEVIRELGVMLSEDDRDAWIVAITRGIAHGSRREAIELLESEAGELVARAAKRGPLTASQEQALAESSKFKPAPAPVAPAPADGADEARVESDDEDGGEVRCEACSMPSVRVDADGMHLCAPCFEEARQTEDPDCPKCEHERRKTDALDSDMTKLVTERDTLKTEVERNANARAMMIEVGHALLGCDGHPCRVENGAFTNTDLLTEIKRLQARDDAAMDRSTTSIQAVDVEKLRSGLVDAAEAAFDRWLADDSVRTVGEFIADGIASHIAAARIEGWTHSRPGPTATT